MEYLELVEFDFEAGPVTAGCCVLLLLVHLYFIITFNIITK